MIISNEQVNSIIMNYRKIMMEDFEVPFSTMYKIRKNMKKIEQLSIPLADTYKAIIAKCGADTPEFRVEIEQVNKVENDCDIDLISASEFNDIKVTPAFMEAIFFMLTD